MCPALLQLQDLLMTAAGAPPAPAEFPQPGYQHFQELPGQVQPPPGEGAPGGDGDEDMQNINIDE